MDLREFAEQIVGGPPEGIADWQWVAEDLFDTRNSVDKIVGGWISGATSSQDAMSAINEIMREA